MDRDDLVVQSESQEMMPGKRATNSSIYSRICGIVVCRENQNFIRINNKLTARLDQSNNHLNTQKKYIPMYALVDKKMDERSTLRIV